MWKYRKKKKATSKFRSGLEVSVIENLTKRKVSFKYEKCVVHYFKPSKEHKYTPDLELDNGLIIEIKGYLKREDRMKHILVKQQHPKLDIRFVFGNSKNKIYKTSKTTYADWCTKNGFQYADKLIPEEWLWEIKKTIKH
jgi:hypothetical protein